MSRVGKNPVTVDQSVEVALQDHSLTVKGKLGSLSRDFPKEVNLSFQEGKIKVDPVNKDDARSRSMWGLSRTLVQNMVKGVSDGWTKDLEMTGVGYKASIVNNMLVLFLGYSHEIMYAIPKGITIKCDKPTSISVFGSDKQLVGQVAAEIRLLRKPEPYKGKGIRYKDEVIRRKETKKK
jgi:large subunit ribosomal protein L6